MLEFLEALSYLVTIIGLPFGIGVFIYEQRRERLNEGEEIYQRLSDEYAKFLKLLLDHADLHLVRRNESRGDLTEEQTDRILLIFELLISLFERAYILVYAERMDKQTQRLWMSWEDYIREWCRREDFRKALPRLLQGEDPDFRRHIQTIADEESQAAKILAG